MRRSGRRLKALASVVVAAVALAAAAGVVEGLVAWRAQAEATELRDRYLAGERALARERGALADFGRNDRGAGTTRGQYPEAAFAVAQALAATAELAPSGERRQLSRLVSTHETATRAALRALTGTPDDPRRQPDFQRATRLLGEITAAVESLSSSSWPAAAWPRTPRDYIELLALALAALAGISTMARVAIVLMTRPKPQQRRSSDHELARLVTEARTDSLTRLANHRAFHDDLAAEIERRNTTGSVFGLMAIDLDGLKAINDTHGHQAGDAYIVRLSQAIRTVVGSAGSVYRTGGDEFMVLLPGSRNWHAINIGHRILAATKTRTGARTLSIGVTETQGTEHRQALIRQADLALYEAKRATLGVVPFKAGMEPAAATLPAVGYSPDQMTLAATLARTVDARNSGARNHSETVAELAAGIAARQGIQGHRLERIRVAALLHDVGKIGVPDAILHKQTSLVSSEQEEMRDHIAVGRDLLLAAGFVEEATWVYHHHEHYDGSGYPEGLRGEEIPLEARAIAVADAFEVMTGSRPYRQSVSAEHALAEILECAGSQFDPECVQALADLVSGTLSTALLSSVRGM